MSTTNSKSATYRQKFTVICTVDRNGNEFNFQVNGWKREVTMEKLAAKYAPNNFFFDYVCGYANENISCTIHKRINA